MGWVVRMRRSAAAGVIVVTALLAGLLVGPAAAAVEACSYDAGTRTVTATIATGGEATLKVVSGALHFGATPVACGVATTTNTDSILVNGSVGSDERLVLDHRGGVFGPGFTPESNIPEIEIHADMGDATDTIAVYATEGNDYMAAGQNGLALNTDGDVDVTFTPNPLKLEFHMLGGDDYFNGRGEGGAGRNYLGPIFIDGGEGNDWLLRGGADADVIYGGPGNDVLEGQQSDDYLDGGPGNDSLSGGAGNDIMIGGPGVDSFAASSGDDIMYGQDGEADASFNGGPGNDTAYVDTGLDPSPVATENVIGSGDPPPPPVEIATTSLPGGSVGQAYSQSITATNGATPYTWSIVSGSLPPGLSISTSGTPSTTISGTPTTTGTYGFTVQVTDADTGTDTQELSISVAEAPPPPPDGIAFGGAGTAGAALASSVAVPYPSGVAANDLLILHVMTRDNVEIATPAGFVEGGARNQGAGLRSEWFWKRATGSESGSVTVTKASGTTLFFGRMVRFTGVVTSGAPFEGAVDTGGSTKVLTPADVTTSGPDRRVVVLTAEEDDLVLDSYTGGTATLPEDVAEARTGLGADGALGVNSLTRASAETFDPGSQTIAFNRNHVLFTFALIPA